jgi:hypothetical protein
MARISLTSSASSRLAAARKALLQSGGDNTTLTLTDAKMTSAAVLVFTYQPAGMEAEVSPPNTQ